MTVQATQGATVLVTGGTGSFGSTMVRRLLDADVGEIRILSRDELKQDDMRRRFADPRLRFYIGDVRDYDSVHRATRGVDFVFHAAALKQVPSCEFFPLEAVRTNVLGSANVIEACNANEVRSLVCLGTDKAAYPVNAMGMSKALMEKVAQAFARNNPTAATTCRTVRYGNVMMSRGSVIPLFVEQARAGRPMTVTDPDMTRFLMSLDEAVLLVEHAFDARARRRPLHPQGPGLHGRGARPRPSPGCWASSRRSRSSAPGTARSSTRRWPPARSSPAPRTRATTSASPSTPATSTTASTSTRASVEESHADDYHSHNTERLDVDAVVDLIGSMPPVAAAGGRDGPGLTCASSRSTATTGPTPRRTRRCCARSWRGGRPRVIAPTCSPPSRRTSPSSVCSRDLAVEQVDGVLGASPGLPAGPHRARRAGCSTIVRFPADGRLACAERARVTTW